MRRLGKRPLLHGDTMFNLKNNPVLTGYQIKILKIFFNSNIGQKFFLTGGTALSAFYLAHRLSKDLDLFSIEEFDSLELEKLVEQIASITNAEVKTKVKTKRYNEIYLENRKKGWIQRIDFVKEQPLIFGKRKRINDVIVDSLENISSGKILAIYGRFEPKDYLDLYFIFKETDLDFFELFEKTKKKDLGLNEFYFANMISDVKDLKNFPKTIKPVDKEELIAFFLSLSDKLFKKIKPK